MTAPTSKSRPLISAHRGSSGHEPENTLRAFELAIAQGAQMIELDLHLSHDDHVVVIHDDDLEGSTDRSGLIASLTLAEIRKADAGKGERVPTLQETLELARNRVQLYLELKGAGVAESAIQAVREFEMLDQVLFASFDMALMQQLGSDHRDLRLGLILGADSYDPLVRFREQFPWIAYRDFNYQFLSLHVRLCRRQSIETAQKSGKQVFAWTANTEREFSKLTSRGVDGIVTDFPDRLVAFVAGL